MLPSTALWCGPSRRDTEEAPTHSQAAQVGQKTPEVSLPVAMQHRWGGHHFDEHVHGETVEKEKWNDLCTVKRGRTGDAKAVRYSLMEAAYAVP